MSKNDNFDNRREVEWHMHQSAEAISVNNGGNSLSVHYQCRTDHVIYSIADFGGNVIFRNQYSCASDSEISIEHLAAGAYVLCIIDGDQLTKFKFLKS